MELKIVMSSWHHGRQTDLILKVLKVRVPLLAYFNHCFLSKKADRWFIKRKPINSELMLHIFRLAFHWKLRAVISWCYSSFEWITLLIFILEENGRYAICLVELHFSVACLLQNVLINICCHGIINLLPLLV